VRGGSTRTSYDAWHARREVDRELNTPWHELLFVHLQPQRDVAAKRVLEMACGRGGLACRLAGAAVLKARTFATSHGLDAIHWEVGDLQELAHPDATFDTVISCETIEHLPRPRAALGEMARVLKPGGRLFLTTPNYLGLMGVYRIYARLRRRPYSEEGQPINRCLLLPRTVLWIRWAGLRVTAVEAAGHYFPWPGAPPRRLDRVQPPRVFRWLALHSLVVAEKP